MNSLNDQSLSLELSIFFIAVTSGKLGFLWKLYKEGSFA